MEEILLTMGLTAITTVLTKYPSIATKFGAQLKEVCAALISAGYGPS